MRIDDLVNHALLKQLTCALDKSVTADSSAGLLARTRVVRGLDMSQVILMFWKYLGYKLTQLSVHVCIKGNYIQLSLQRPSNEIS